MADRKGEFRRDYEISKSEEFEPTIPNNDSQGHDEDIHEPARPQDSAYESDSSSGDDHPVDPNQVEDSARSFDRPESQESHSKDDSNADREHDEKDLSEKEKTSSEHAKQEEAPSEKNQVSGDDRTNEHTADSQREKSSRSETSQSEELSDTAIKAAGVIPGAGDIAKAAGKAKTLKDMTKMSKAEAQAELKGAAEDMLKAGVKSTITSALAYISPVLVPVIAALLVLLILFSVMFSSMERRTQQANEESKMLCEDQNSTSSDGFADSGGGSGGGEVPNKDNIKAIYSFLHDDYGFSAPFIAGILGNWKQESQIDPTAVQSGMSGVKNAEMYGGKPGHSWRGLGYGQWTAERHTQLTNYAKSKSKKWYTTDLQLSFMVTEDAATSVLKTLALAAGDDPVEEAVNFHRDWEISADPAGDVRTIRGGNAKVIYEWMKKNGMDGGSDKKKINKIKAGTSSNIGDTSASSSDSGSMMDCGDSASYGDGKIGDSVKANGGTGKAVHYWKTWSEVPKEYQKYVTAPLPDITKDPLKSMLAKSPFQSIPAGPPLGSLRGQCTELTWAYMSTLWEGNMPTMGNGGDVWASYKAAGAKITTNPTVGYGFSSRYGLVGAGDGAEGHTGVIIGVIPSGPEKGRYITANFNTLNKAPDRGVTYELIDGQPKGSDLVSSKRGIFFSGPNGGKAKVDLKK